MKKILSFLSVLFFVNYSSFAQAPQGINYQGVARNSSGQAYSVANISVQVTFLQNGSNIVYKEHQTVTTDTFGLYSIVIGSPSAVVTQGAFASIPWSGGNLLVQVDIDPAGGASYTTVSTMSVQSVPYALYAQTSGNSSNGTVTSVNANTPLSVINSTSTPTISISQSGATSNGYLSSTDWNTFNNKVSSISNGTGILSAVTNQSYTLSADNGNAIWNANKLLGTPVNTTLPPLTNDILLFNGTNWVNVPLPPALPTPTVGSLLFTDGTNAWKGTNPSNLFTDGSKLGLGTNAPAASIEITGSNVNGGIKSIQNGVGGSAGLFAVMNASNDSAAVIAYTAGKGPGVFGISQGAGHGGVFANSNPASAAAGVLASAYGTGKAVFGINMGMGYGGVFMINKAANDSDAVAGITPGGGAAVHGMNAGSGPGGVFEIWSATNPSPAIHAVTSGTGYSGQFSGGLGLQTDKFQMPTGAASNYVLTSDASGNATWQPAGGGSLPSPVAGAMLFAPTASNWAASNPSNIFSDGTSITVTNTTSVGTAGTFITNNASAANAPALQATSNSSTGYAIRADNSNGAAILANSGGPYAIAGNISGGNGDAVAGWLRNSTTSGYGIYGLIDNTSAGTAGYFENQNSANTQPVLQVVNLATSSGKSAIFSGGSGVQIDNLQVQTNLNIPLNPNPGWVLTCSNTGGDAVWQAPSAGVTSVTVTSPIVNTGTATSPIIGILPGNGSTPGYISVADWNNFNMKLSTVSVSAPLIGNGTGGAPLQVGLNSGDIFVGNPSNVAAPVPMTGDVNITNTGVTTVTGLQGRGILAGVPLANQVLQFNGTNWVNSSIITLPSGSGGQMLYHNGSVWTGSASNSLFFTGTNLGIGNPAPTSLIDVSGSASTPNIKSVNTGSVSEAGTFTVTNAANSAAAIVAGTSGTGPAIVANAVGGNGINAVTTGTTGVAGSFQNTSTANNNPVVNVTANGAGPGVNVNASGSGTAVEAVTTSASGAAGFFQVNNAASNNTAVTIQSNANVGAALYVANSGTGRGTITDKFQMTSGAPTQGAVLVSTNNVGDAAWSGAVNFAAQGGNTTATNTVATTVSFGATNYANPPGCFNGTTFTAQNNGVHHFDCGVSMNVGSPIATAQDFVVRLVVGGSAYREASVHLPVNFAGVVQNVLSADAQLGTGQTVQVQVFQTTGQNLTVVSGPQAVQTFFNGHFVH